MLEEMVRSKFWTGLRSDRIKTALRHRLDDGASFEVLLRQARTVESEIETKATGKAAVNSQQVENKKLDEILQLVNSLDVRLKKVEASQKSSSSGAASAPPLGRAKSGQQRDKFAGRKGVCHHCGDPSHIRPNCPVLYNHLKE